MRSSLVVLSPLEGDTLKRAHGSDLAQLTSEYHSRNYFTLIEEFSEADWL